MSQEQPNLENPALGRFDDFDRFAAATRGWDFDFRQLDRGPLSAEVFQACSRDSILMRVRFSRALDQRGCSPPGFLTFGILDSGVSGVCWRGREATDRSLLAFDEANGFDATSRPGFAGFTYSITEERLARVAEVLGLPEFDRRLVAVKNSAVCRSGLVAGLRDHLRGLCDELVKDGSLATQVGFREQIEFELPRRLLSAIASDTAIPTCESARARRVALKKARAFIRDNLVLPPTVQQVCEYTGVSWRTLDYAFREHFEMTPQAYLKAVRLDEARRWLRSGACATVNEAAHQAGFWHMGKFAADYRSQFGELPSKTLRRDSPALP
jgi:AraC family ethanolamine operon transcriptional activator